MDTHDEKLKFKIGFLKKCAEAGLSFDETYELALKINNRLDKQASLLSFLSQPVGSALSSVTGTIGNVGVAAGLLAPPAIGWGLGRGYTYLTDVDTEDIDEIKKKELIEEYRRQTEKLKKLRREYRRA